MEKRKSGQMVASDHIAALEIYLADLKVRGEPVPTRLDGKVNLTKVAKDSGVKDRGRFYTNEKLMGMIDNAMAEGRDKPTSPPEQPEPANRASETTDESQRPAALQRAERQVHKLEQANAALVAENAELRRQLKASRLQLGREDMIIETARRVLPPTNT